MLFRSVPSSWNPDGYLEGTEAPRDPWNNFYLYQSPGPAGEDFIIISLGSDRKEGGEGYDKDLSSADLK